MIVLSGCCAFTGVKQPQTRATLQTPAEILKNVTVALVHVGEEDKVSPYCSGVWIANNIILTANHCIEDEGRPDREEDEEWTTNTGAQINYVVHNDVLNTMHPDVDIVYKAEVLVQDRNNDIAIVKTNKGTPAHFNATISKDVIHDGQVVHIVGHTVGLWWSYIGGWVSSDRPHIDLGNRVDVHMLQLTAPAYMGNSGGGAFNENLQLIGICSSVGRGPNITFFSHRDEIVKFLTRNRIRL